MFFDPLYLVILVPITLLSLWASGATRSRFSTWARVANRRGITGAQAARYILDQNGLMDVSVVPSDGGQLSDHYDPARRAVRLSPEVFHGGSVSAIAVAAHETGHALQHARGYAPLMLRNIAVPVASIGGNLGVFLIMMGAVFAFTQLIWAGILFFSATVFFQLITLPVEIDASSRAKHELEKWSLVLPGDKRGVRAVLSAAAMTYVAAALGSVATLAYYVFRLGGVGDDRR
jgi:Zn-dependent membrane protease YugP